MITKNVKLYLGDGYHPVRIPVSQFDTMWQFVFTIIHNSQPWQIPTGATAVLNGKKPDGNVFAFAGTIENNTVTVDADVQMTAVAGQTVCELSIIADGKTVGTANFILDVEEAPKSPDDVVSDTVLDGYGMMVTNAVDDYIERHPEVFGGDKFTQSAKNALLALLEKVAYIEENGQTYIDALESELFPPASLVSITAVFNQGENTIYDTDSLDVLKQYLTVMENYDDGTTQTVSNYTLSGTLTEGTSTITVAYGGKTATFNVNVTVSDPAVYRLTNRVFANDGSVDTNIAYLTTDKSFTITCDADFAGQQSGQSWCLFKMMNPNPPYNGVAVTSVNSDINYMLIVWMTAKNASSGISSNISLPYSYTGNVKIVLTHEVGSGEMNYFVKAGSNNVVSGTLANAYQTITTNLAVGGNLSNSQKFNGTVNSFCLYGEVLSNDDINNFLS